MNKELQQIKIAEACGWKRHADGLGYYQGVHPAFMGGRAVPDYLNDLNAMHEAESSLTEEQFYIYGSYLDTITLPKKSMPMCYVDSPEAGMYRELICATAAQRAEAFLKTLGLWEEEA